MYIHFAKYNVYQFYQIFVLLKNNFDSKGNLNVKIEDTMN